MTPADHIQWIVANEATVGPVLTDRECTGWYCRTPRTTTFLEWTALGLTEQPGSPQ